MMTLTWAGSVVVGGEEGGGEVIAKTQRNPPFVKRKYNSLNQQIKAGSAGI